jgi:hypothetical protein
VFWDGVDAAAYVLVALHSRARKSCQLRQPNNTTDSDSESDESGSGSSQTSDEKYHSDSSGSFARTDGDETVVHCYGIVLVVGNHLKNQSSR